MLKYLWNVLLTIDQGVNVMFSPVLNPIFGTDNNKFGNPDETLSSVLGKNIRAGDCKLCGAVCWVLNLLQTDHCKKSIEQDNVA